MFKRVLAVFLMALLPLSAFGLSLTYENKQDKIKITLHDTKCSVKSVLDEIKPEFRPKFQNGEAEFDGKKVRFCWTTERQDPGTLFLLDEQGEMAVLPMVLFAKQPEKVI